jgi:Cro/C1-type HTH DNA-binding domain
MTAAWVLVLGERPTFIARADDPGTPILLLGMVLTGGVLLLLTVMMYGAVHRRVPDAVLTPANVAVLKNGRAKAVRFSTLEAMCRVLDCQPGDLLEWVED